MIRTKISKEEGKAHGMRSMRSQEQAAKYLLPLESQTGRVLKAVVCDNIEKCGQRES